MIPEQYTLHNLKRAIADPSMFHMELKRNVGRVKRMGNPTTNPIIGGKLLEREYGPAINFMEADWDNLIIIDACRHDIFREHNFIEGDLKSVVSNASHSMEFMEKTFQGRSYHDTVCVTANPYAQKTLNNAVFHDKITTYTGIHPPSVTRSEKRSAKRVYDIARDEYNNYPNKRFLVHFMQPHTPYHGDKAEALRTELAESEGIAFKSWQENEEVDEDQVYRDLLDAAQQGVDISHQDLREVYVENLYIVLEYVNDLIQELSGKTVVTADHGELLGDPESRLVPYDYWHYPGVYCKELRVVPWFVVEEGPRPRITSEEPVETTNVSDRDLDEHLEALGYR